LVESGKRRYAFQQSGFSCAILPCDNGDGVVEHLLKAAFEQGQTERILGGISDFGSIEPYLL
jgi:hypothetical protein